jgi:hypothetical protein
MRPSAAIEASLLMVSSDFPAKKSSVFVGPGEMVFTVIPRAPISLAKTPLSPLASHHRADRCIMNTETIPNFLFLQEKNPGDLGPMPVIGFSEKKCKATLYVIQP